MQWPSTYKKVPYLNLGESGISVAIVLVYCGGDVILRKDITDNMISNNSDEHDWISHNCDLLKTVFT